MTFHSCGKWAATVQASGLVMMGEECQVFFFLIHYHPLKPSPDQTHIHRLGCTGEDPLQPSRLLGVHGTCEKTPPSSRGSLHPPTPHCLLLLASSRCLIFTLLPFLGASLHLHLFVCIPAPASLCHHLCDCIPADLWARRDHTVPSRALSIPKAAPGMVPRACALGRLPCREAGGAALEGHQDFSEDESVLKCQTNFPNYLSGHFLPSALEDGGGTFHSLRAGVERGCVRSRELPAAPAAQPRFSPASSLSHRGCCPGIIGGACPSPQPPKPLPAQPRALPGGQLNSRHHLSSRRQQDLS